MVVVAEVVVHQVQQALLVVGVLGVVPIEPGLLEQPVRVTVEEKVDGLIIHQVKVMVVVVVDHLQLELVVKIETEEL